MSWSAFEELKGFASSIYGSKKKRKKDWNTPTETKRQRTSKQLSNGEEGSIDGFSSSEEKDETSRSFLSEECNKKNPEHTETNSDVRRNLESVIDDIEDTPDADDKNQLIPSTSCQTTQVNQVLHEEEDLEELLDAMIKDFNSSDEEEKVQEPEVLDIDIDTATPTPTPTPTLTPTCSALPDRTPKTGSAWLKQVQHHTSSPSQGAPPSPDVKIDSAKKKPKFKRSGLAEQLQRLVNREKSEKSFWGHKQTVKKNDQNASGDQDSTSALDVQVLSLQTQYSLYITRCCVLSNKQESTTPNVLDVLFNTQTMKQLTLRVGSAVRIHPPWQKLNVPSSPYPILLCTYYCTMLSTPTGSPPVNVTTLPGKHPQASHLVSSPKKSFQPTRLLFGEPQTKEKYATNSSESMAANEASQSKPTKELPSIAKAIEAQGGCSGGNVSFEAVVQRVYKRRVKIAREKAIDSPGDVFLSKTLVTRARSAEDKEESRLVILVQDSSKNVCEIQIPEEHACREDWNSCVRNGTGKAYRFDDLRIAQRTNRTRSPGLFDVMDSLWWPGCRSICQEANSSQILSSDESSSQTPKPTSPPCYCYLLAVHESSQVTSLDHDQYQDLSSLYTPPLLRHLQELSLANENTPKRCAVWCRVICSRPNLFKHATRHHSNHLSWTGQVLVTDTSLYRATQESQDSKSSDYLSRYVKLEVRPSNVLTDTVRKAVREPGSVLYMENIACSSQEAQGIYADSYTTIKRGLTDPCQADIHKGDVQVMPLDIYTELVALRTQEFIIPLSLNTTVGSLCKVQGVVQGLDEESACCWIECSTCGCQDLVERSGLPYYCPFCKADVHGPQTKTNLDVNIKCDSWREGQVVVKLLQATIEQLLPVSYQDTDQGYDIDCVLGKSLGPLYCYVKEHTGLTAKLDEIAVSI